MAVYKTSLRHPASWVHSGIHFACALFVFPLWACGILFLLHLLIDTRVPLAWWRRVYRQSQDVTSPSFIPFAMWQDQMAHVLCIVAVARLAAGG
jgi:hypothetical protein